MTQTSVHIQLSSEFVPSLPSWFGEVAIVAEFFRKSGLLKAIKDQVREIYGMELYQQVASDQRKAAQVQINLP